MEKAREKPFPRGDAQTDDAHAGDARVSVHRCPFCHDGVTASDSAVCCDCLARHHPGCWNESGRCGACGGVRRLSPEPLTLAAATKLLEGHGYRPEEVQALLAPIREATSTAFFRRVWIPIVLMLMTGGIVGGTLMAIADMLLRGPEEDMAMAAGAIVGLIVGVTALVLALRRS